MTPNTILQGDVLQQLRTLPDANTRLQKELGMFQ